MDKRMKVGESSNARMPAERGHQKIQYMKPLSSGRL
jgi:hypothetical protein